MSQSQTGADLILLLKKLSSEESKFFLPDIGREEAVANSLIDAYGYEDVATTAEAYVKKASSPIMVFSFAMDAPSIIGKAVAERKSRERFLEIVEQTRERMDKRK